MLKQMLLYDGYTSTIYTRDETKTRSSKERFLEKFAKMYPGCLEKQMMKLSESFKKYKKVVKTMEKLSKFFGYVIRGQNITNLIISGKFMLNKDKD